MTRTRACIFVSAAFGCLFLMTACGGKSTGLDTAQCSNPILINDSSMQHVARMSDLPAGTFRLSSIQVYYVDQSTNDSFTASATSMDGFSSVSMDCNGVQSSNGTVTATANAATSMDFVDASQSQNSIKLSFEFDNGQLVLANSSTVPGADNGLSSGTSDEIPNGQVQIGPDEYRQIAVYAPTSTQVDVRMEIESPAVNGKRKLEFVRVGYTRM